MTLSVCLSLTKVLFNGSTDSPLQKLGFFLNRFSLHNTYIVNLTGRQLYKDARGRAAISLKAGCGQRGQIYFSLYSTNGRPSQGVANTDLPAKNLKSMCTDKKENQIFLIYSTRKFGMEQLQSIYHLRPPLLIYREIFAHFLIY